MSAPGRNRLSGVYFRSKIQGQNQSARRHQRRLYPEALADIVYPDHLLVRKVRLGGYIKLNGHSFYITRQLTGEYVGLESLGHDRWQLYFSELRLAVVDERLKRVIRPG